MSEDTASAAPPNLSPAPRPAVLRYATAVVLSAAAFAVAAAFHNWLSEWSPLATFYAAVAVSSWFGGLGPGLVAVVLGAVAADYYLLEPRFDFGVKSPAQIGRLGLFVAVGTLIVWLNGRLLKASALCDREARAARASEARAARLAESNLIGVFFSDAEGHVHGGNEAFLRLTAHTREDLATGSVNWRHLTAPEHRHRDEYALDELRRSGVCTPYEKDHVLADGRRVPVLMGCARLQDETGEGGPADQLLVGFLMDLTPRRMAEAEARAHQQRLAALSVELVEAEGRERRRIASVLHDSIGQTLSLARLKLEAAAAPGESAQPLHEIEALVVEALRQARELTSELSPPVLYELGLVPALRWLAERTAAQNGLVVEVAAESFGQPLPRQAQVVLFETARELVHNVIKHARTERCTIRVGAVGDEVVLEVRDNGRGFDPATGGFQGGSHEGFGLFSVRERLRRLGGDVEILAQPGTGTRVTVRLPARLPGAGFNGARYERQHEGASGREDPNPPRRRPSDVP